MSKPAPLFHGVEALLFDLDGTLVVTNNRWAERLAPKLEPLRCLWSRCDTHALARQLVVAVETPANYALSLLEHLGLGSGLFGLSDRVRRSKGLATSGGAELIAGSEELLAALSRRYRLAAVTTRGRPEAHAFIASTGLGRLIQVIVTRQDVLWMKPHPEPVRKAARLLGVAPEHCVMVGDTVMDIRAARRAGAYAVGVLTGLGERGELECAGAHVVLADVTQLPACLDPLPADGAGQEEGQISLPAL